MSLDLIKIKIAMAKKCLSVNELADNSGLGRSTVSKLINGKAEPTTKSLGLLAKALNVDVTEIIAEE